MTSKNYYLDWALYFLFVLNAALSIYFGNYSAVCAWGAALALLGRTVSQRMV